MPPYKRKFLRLVKPVAVGLAAVFFAALIAFSLKKISPIVSFAAKNKLSPVFFISLLFQKEPGVKMSNNRMNMVILGVSGGDHDGANLTDSNIFLSIDFKKGDIVMVSVPRDVWLPSLKTKINSVYYYGEKKKPGGGLILSKSSVSEVIGQPVNYAFKIDFTAFQNIIDMIGGIDINLENGFTDKLFPIPGRENDFCASDPEFKCRYETIRFEKGTQHLDGETALKFVRSRNAENGEGNDFSRSHRQQQVITAIISKVKGMVSLGNLPLLKNLFDETYKYVETDMTLSEMSSIGKYFFFNQNSQIRQVVLDSGDDIRKIPGLMVNPPLWEYSGVWVLTPRTGDYKEIHDYISCQLEKGVCDIKDSI